MFIMFLNRIIISTRKKQLRIIHKHHKQIPSAGFYLDKSGANIS